MLSNSRWFPSLNLKQWLALVLINIVISTVTALLVVRALTITPRNPIAVSASATTVPPTALRTPIPPTPTPVPPNAPAKPASGAQPPAQSDKVKISSVSSVGQLQSEQLVIANEGSDIDLKDWKISSNRGVTYRFRQVVLFKDSFINVYSMVGADTSVHLFMGRSDAAWRTGDIITLESNDGRKISSFEVK
jgi:hypothetical protein